MQLRGSRDRVCDHMFVRTIAGRRLAVTGWVATVGLLVLIGPGAVRPAGAGSLTIGAGSTVQLGDAVLNMGCNDLRIEPAGMLEAQASTIRLAGNWDNGGHFDPGTGTVVLEDGCGPPETTRVAGSSTFFDLQILTSMGKTVRLEAGATQTILGNLGLMGMPGHLLMLRSTMPGHKAFLDLAATATQHVDYVDVADNGATGRLVALGPPAAYHSIDSGNTMGWFFVVKGTAPVASRYGIAGLVVGLLAVAGLRLRRARPAARGAAVVSE